MSYYYALTWPCIHLWTSFDWLYDFKIHFLSLFQSTFYLTSRIGLPPLQVQKEKLFAPTRVSCCFLFIFHCGVFYFATFVHIYFPIKIFLRIRLFFIYRNIYLMRTYEWKKSGQVGSHQKFSGPVLNINPPLAVSITKIAYKLHSVGVNCQC